MDKKTKREKKLKGLGKKIKKARNQLNLTLEKLGNMIGYSAAIISRWERGIKEPKYMAIKELEKKLNIEI